MPPRQTESEGALYSAIFFAALAIIVGVIAIVLYVKLEDYRKSAEDARDALDQVAKTNEIKDVGTIEKRKTVTVQDVIDVVIQNTTGEPLPPDRTIDNLKAGRPGQKVTGIVTTFLATLEMLQKTETLGANLVLTHEPTYYNHFDNVDALKGDPVYEAKRRFIDESGIAIWRMHDYWHIISVGVSMIIFLALSAAIMNIEIPYQMYNVTSGTVETG